jgi:hypothetical protein
MHANSVLLLLLLSDAPCCRWLPSYLRATTSLAPQSIMWALIAGMLTFAAAAPYGGTLVDRGMPKVWALMALSLGVAAISIPVMFTLQSGTFVFLVVLMPCMLGLAGCMGGLISSIGPQMYPSAVRATGFTLSELTECSLHRWHTTSKSMLLMHQCILLLHQSGVVCFRWPFTIHEPCVANDLLVPACRLAAAPQSSR